MEPADYKFCPSCKLRNRADAVICEYCGTPFPRASERSSTTKDVDKETRVFQGESGAKIEIPNMEAPAEGIAIFTLGLTDPIETRLESEFVIGRLTEATEEKVVDLTPYDAYALGVSRRHLSVRRAGHDYTVTDLNSANGTWVNEERLEPQLPVTVKSGSQIRLGNMRIFISFRP